MNSTGTRLIGLMGLIEITLAVTLTLPFTQTASAQTTGTVRGVLTVDGKASASGLVQLRDAKTTIVVATARVGAAGQFVFGGVAAGIYVIESIGNPAGVIGASSDPFVFTGGDASVDVDEDAGAMRAAGTGLIRGSLWKSDNAGIRDGRVQLRDMTSQRVALIGTTDQHGAFVFANVPPGNYEIEYVTTDARALLAVSKRFTVRAGEQRTVLVKNPW